MGSTRLFVTADCPDLIAFQRPQPYLKVLRREVTKEGGAHLSTRVGGSGKFSSHTVYADAPNGPSRCSSVATCGSLSAAFRYTRTGQHLGARLAGTVVVNFEGGGSRRCVGCRCRAVGHRRVRGASVYKIVLSHADSDSLISFGRSANVKKFAEAWKAMSDGPRKGLAKWAWGQSDGFMRRMMQFYPQDDEGVWGTLCAPNDGTGPCHMVGSKR